MAPITIVLADDHQIVRSGLRVLLESDLLSDHPAGRSPAPPAISSTLRAPFRTPRVA
jgi:hypothetical protein